MLILVGIILAFVILRMEKTGIKQNHEHAHEDIWYFFFYFFNKKMSEPLIVDKGKHYFLAEEKCNKLYFVWTGNFSCFYAVSLLCKQSNARERPTNSYGSFSPFD